MNQTNNRSPLRAPVTPIRPRGAVSPRRALHHGGSIAALVDQLAIARAAAVTEAARHRAELRTIAQAYSTLYAEHVELQARADGAAAVLRERCEHLAAALNTSDARLVKLQAERDAFSRALRSAREERSRLAGQVEAFKAVQGGKGRSTSVTKHQ